MDIIAGSGRQLLGLLVVFSLLGLTVWRLERFRGGWPPARWKEIPLRKAFSGKVFAAKNITALERVERLALTPQHTLHVLRLHGREMLVATHPQGCTLLHPHGCTLMDNAPAPTARGVGA